MNEYSLGGNYLKPNILTTHKQKHYYNLKFWEYVKKEKFLYIMMLPVIMYFIVFHYAPMFGIILAFKNFSPFRGFVGSPWVGLRHFQNLFGSPEFGMILGNTIWISLIKLFWGFPAPIILALLLNEVRNAGFKRVVQTVSYLPHFLSWVIIGSLVTFMLSLNGPINELTKLFGQEPRQFLLESSIFRSLLVVTDIWKGVGWGTLLYLASISGIDQNLYEAAYIDGAGRLKQTTYITIPSIKGVVIILFIFNIGGILSAGFEQIFILQNPMVRQVSEIVDTYVYKRGIVSAQYSFATAVGIFKSVVGLILISGTNYLAKKVGEEALW